MNPAQTSARPQPAPAFEDGFGRRQQVVSASKEPVEVLVLKREHLAIAGFEAAVRERIEQVARFQHDAFVRVRGLARLAKTESGTALVSERVDGIRLSQLLDPSAQRALHPHGALMLIKQLMDAIVAFHETVHGCHGAIALERLILRPDARLMVAEHVFGGALPRLSLTGAALWEQMQIAVPDGPTPVFDQQTDLLQAGSVALALMLGRPLGVKYPNRVSGRAGSSPLSLTAAMQDMPQDVANWIARAIQRRGSEPFASSSAAREAFEAILLTIDRAAGRNAILAFQSGEPVSIPATARPVAAAAPARVSAPKATPAPVPAAPPAVARVADTQPTAASRHDDEKSEPAEHVDESPAMPFGAVSASAHSMRRFFVPMTRRTIGVAAAVLMFVTTGGAFAAKRYFTTPTAPVAKGTLAVTTTPAGANVVIDGEQRGRAPMTIELPAGDHVLQVGLDGASRTIGFKVTAGAQVSQVIDLPKAAAATGQLQVRTEPSGARVVVDGQKRGASPVTVEGLMPGVHTVTVEGPAGTVTQEVTVASGVTAAVVVPLNTAAAAPASGWLSVSSPVDVQIHENGQLLGTNRSAKIAAPVGRHDLEISNDALGYRVTRSITVAPGETSAMKLEPPKGSLSLNATPWAEVWIDGQRAGETPIGNVQLSIGQHEVVFRHPELGERRFTPTITLTAPARLTADFRRTP